MLVSMGVGSKGLFPHRITACETGLKSYEVKPEGGEGRNTWKSTWGRERWRGQGEGGGLVRCYMKMEN